MRECEKKTPWDADRQSCCGPASGKCEGTRVRALSTSGAASPARAAEEVRGTPRGTRNQDNKASVGGEDHGSGRRPRGVGRIRRDSVWRDGDGNSEILCRATG